MKANNEGGGYSAVWIVINIGEVMERITEMSNRVIN